MDIHFEVVNVVATADLGHFIDLEKLANDFFMEIIHDPEIYGGRVAYFKSKEMEGKVSIFSSGKMISIGTRSINKAKKELELVAKILQGNLKIKPSIHNIVATANFGFEIDLEKLVSSDKFNSIYEPEQFPAVILRMQLDNKKASFLIFASGNIVCTGLSKMSRLEEAFKLLFSNVFDVMYSRTQVR